MMSQMRELFFRHEISSALFFLVSRNFIWQTFSLRKIDEQTLCKSNDSVSDNLWQAN